MRQDVQREGERFSRPVGLGGLPGLAQVAAGGGTRGTGGQRARGRSEWGAGEVALLPVAGDPVGALHGVERQRRHMDGMGGRDEQSKGEAGQPEGETLRLEKRIDQWTHSGIPHRSR